ncbi:actin-like protein Arp8 [Schizosaccharomyces cryophilus OY26]|uniref:Actin-like protein Arp8 n=1 Tax=Schizosaccharomyces cryophilus (strain OY26 / ATCC MYA-4695 / CBS 11777 / NBRC 106824 / NRRL Y48691) TaxID=653667 RepID=S9XII1_SCHCR|nr:actin-like protein Arp8 [Schizosaccharomyces cryophilus OY26]EPY53461.1 actin-like protein Arp8 [Schizosaccharomyces cryophilus OY26]
MAPKRKQSDTEEGIDFKFTQFQIVPPINQKNFYTDYLKRDDQMYIWRDTASAKDGEPDTTIGDVKQEDSKKAAEEEEDGMEENTQEGEQRDAKTVVIHVGSQNLRIGLASDHSPKTVPMVVARRMNTVFEHSHLVLSEKCKESKDRSLRFDEQFESNLGLLQSELKARLKAQKNRPVPNGTELVKNFNKISKPEVIPSHEDPQKPNWTRFENDQRPDVLIGEQALLLPTKEYPEYRLYYPIRNGLFNENDYESSQQLLSDIFEILKYSISDLLQIPLSQLPQYSAIFIVSDLYDRIYIERFLDLLFYDLQFGKTAIVQESLCTSFGAGMSSACVVDVGAEKTSISCVEEGIVIPNSRINIKYGGDDITLLFAKLLTKSHFPYHEMDLSLPYDWNLMQSLKEKYCGISQGTYNIQLNDFHSRTPDDGTKKYSFKVLDETILTPFGYFRPDIFENGRKLKDRYKLFPVPVDVYENQPNNPESLAQTTLLQISAPLSSKEEEEASLEDSAKHELSSSKRPRVVHLGSLASPEKIKEKLVYPLDDAINQSIFSACEGNLGDQAKNLYSSILIVGGGALFPGFSHLLEERLQSKRANIPNVAVLPPPRGLDAQIVAWKGGCIYNRLRIVSEFWIKASDWRMLGSRVLQYKTLGYFWTG